MPLELGVGDRLGITLNARSSSSTLEARHAKAVRERGVDLERLSRDALLRLGLHVLERPHVVDAVAQLDEEHTDVARHGDEHLAEVLRLAVS